VAENLEFYGRIGRKNPATADAIPQPGHR